MDENNQPKGIPFFNIQTGETHYARLGAQIQGYINSSDMGINASRGQDFGWRLGSEWVKKIQAFRADETKMSTLAAKLRLDEEESPSLIQILYAIYGEQLRAARVRAQEGATPYLEEYQQQISNRVLPEDAPVNPGDPVDDKPKPMPSKK